MCIYSTSCFRFSIVYVPNTWIFLIRSKEKRKLKMESKRIYYAHKLPWQSKVTRSKFLFFFIHLTSAIQYILCLYLFNFFLFPFTIYPRMPFVVFVCASNMVSMCFGFELKITYDPLVVVLVVAFFLWNFFFSSLRIITFNHIDSNILYETIKLRIVFVISNPNGNKDMLLHI